MAINPTIVKGAKGFGGGVARRAAGCAHFVPIDSTDEPELTDQLAGARGDQKKPADRDGRKITP